MTADSVASPRYTRTAIALHWVHAFLIVGMLGLGLYMTELPKGPERSLAFNLHKSFGVLAIAIVLVRVAWRLRHRVAEHPALAARETALARHAHQLLYALMIAAPLAGFAAICYTAYPLKFFGLPIPKPGHPDPALNALFDTVHAWVSWTLAIVIALHIAAAARHAVQRDGVMERMLSR